MSEITEQDIYDWLDEQLPAVEEYDPARHVTQQAMAKRYGRNREWARNVLNKLEQEGKMKRVDIHDPNSNTRVAWVRVE